MERPAFAALGLTLIASMMAAFLVLGAVGGNPLDVPFMAANVLGLLLAAVGVRDYVEFPGERTVAIGTTLWAASHFVQFIMTLATPSLWTVPFGLLTLGVITTAAASWHWHFALGDEENTRLFGIRAGVALFGLGILGFTGLQAATAFDPLTLLIQLCGLSGTILFVLFLDTPVGAAASPPAPAVPAATLAP